MLLEAKQLPLFNPLRQRRLPRGERQLGIWDTRWRRGRLDR